jgi:hypothetical protein
MFIVPAASISAIIFNQSDQQTNEHMKAQSRVAAIFNRVLMVGHSCFGFSSAADSRSAQAPH